MSSGHVVINGKKYSLSAGSTASPVRAIDGFVGVTSAKHSPAVKAAQSKKSRRTSKTTSTKKVATSKSQTLNRKAVRKPTATRARTQTIIRPSLNPSKERVQKAASTSQSPMIGKFTASAKALEVKQANILPKTEPVFINAPPATRPNTAIKESVLSRQIDNIKPLVSPKSKKKRRLKAHAVVPVAVFGLFAAGLFVYSSIPAISMEIASRRAGFDAQLPDSPSGFSITGPIQYESGKVAVSYKSNTDERFVNLFQQPSNLDSASLSSGFLESQDIDYETIESGGKTVFIYDGGKATWISKGVWYNLEGESKLDNSQILRLVDSL